MHLLLLFALTDGMFDAALNDTQRVNACYALRGDHSPGVLAAMEKGLALPKLQRCAADRLQEAKAYDAFSRALSAEDPNLRALAAREVSVFQKLEALPRLAELTHDPNLLVATSAMQGLSSYRGPEVLPYFERLSAAPDNAGIFALQRLHERGSASALPIARRFLASTDLAARLAAMAVLADRGDSADLPALQELAKDEEQITAAGRGFGLMPSISLGKAARTALLKIKERNR